MPRWGGVAQSGRNKDRAEGDLSSDDGGNGQLGGGTVWPSWDSIPAICYCRSARAVQRMYLLVASFASVSGEGLRCVPLARHQGSAQWPGFAAHHALGKR